MPGFSRTCETVVWWGGRGHTRAQAFFAEPGEYRLKARYRDLDGTFVESAPVVVRVVPPPSEDDGAYQVTLRRSAEAGRFFLRPSGGAGKRADELREFAAQFGDSRYATYARFALGRGLGWSHEPDDRAEAIALLKLAVEDRSWALRRHGLYELITVLSAGELEALQDASGYLSQLRRDYPDAERIGELEAMVRRAQTTAPVP